MTTSDLKLRIFREIDSLERSKLEDIYGVIMNYINGQRDISDWNKLTANQQQGIYNAIDEMDAQQGILNEKILEKYRKKYSHD